MSTMKISYTTTRPAAQLTLPSALLHLLKITTHTAATGATQLTLTTFTTVNISLRWTMIRTHSSTTDKPAIIMDNLQTISNLTVLLLVHQHPSTKHLQVCLQSIHMQRVDKSISLMYMHTETNNSGSTSTKRIMIPMDNSIRGIEEMAATVVRVIQVGMPFNSFICRYLYHYTITISFVSRSVHRFFSLAHRLLMIVVLLDCRFNSSLTPFFPL